MSGLLVLIVALAWGYAAALLVAVIAAMSASALVAGVWGAMWVSGP